MKCNKLQKVFCSKPLTKSAIVLINELQVDNKSFSAVFHKV